MLEGKNSGFKFKGQLRATSFFIVFHRLIVSSSHRFIVSSLRHIGLIFLANFAQRPGKNRLMWAIMSSELPTSCSRFSLAMAL